MAKSKTIEIPSEVAIDLAETLEKVESILATLEIIMDREVLKGIKEGLEDVEKGRIVRAKAEDIEELLG